MCLHESVTLISTCLIILIIIVCEQVSYYVRYCSGWSFCIIFNGPNVKVVTFVLF